MRGISFFVMVTFFSLHVAHAQEPGLESIPELDTTEAFPQEPPPSLKANGDRVPPEKEIAAWEPQVRVILNEHRSGNLIQSRTEQRRVLRPVVELVMIGGKQVKKTRYVSEEVTVSLNPIASGVTVIDCDSVATQVTVDEKGNKQFEVQLSGQFEFKNDQLALKGSSAELKEGVLTIKNAEMKVGDLTLNSELLQIDLSVQSVHITEPTTEIEPTPLPQPTPLNDAGPFAPTPVPGDGFTSPDFAPAELTPFPSS